MTTQAIYETSDLGQGAFVMALGHPLLGTARDGTRVVFRFPEQARSVAQTFYAGAQVPARAFANSLRDLKALVREAV